MADKKAKAPSVKAPVEEHKRHIDEFLKREEHKTKPPELTLDNLNFKKQFDRIGVRLESVTQQIDFSTPEGHLLFGQMSMYAEYFLPNWPKKSGRARDSARVRHDERRPRPIWLQPDRRRSVCPNEDAKAMKLVYEWYGWATLVQRDSHALERPWVQGPQEPHAGPLVSTPAPSKAFMSPDGCTTPCTRDMWCTEVGELRTASGEDDDRDSARQARAHHQHRAVRTGSAGYEEALQRRPGSTHQDEPIRYGQGACQVLIVWRAAESRDVP